MADQGVGHDGVEARGRHVERVRVADDERDTLADAVLGGEPPRGRDEVRALVDPGHGAGEPVARRDRAVTTPVPQPRSSTAAVRGRSSSSRYASR